MQNPLANIKTSSFILIVLSFSGAFVLTSISNKGLFIKESTTLFSVAVIASLIRQIYKDIISFTKPKSFNLWWVTHWLIQLTLFISTLIFLHNGTTVEEWYTHIIRNNILFSTDTFLIMLSAFSGGLFAAFWTNKYESKRRMEELRRDKYNDHRNTIVQIEQELIPERVNMGKNLVSLETAVKGTNKERFRVLQRLYKVVLSPGLSLKLLNLNLINEYSDLHSRLESINSDIDYHESLAVKIMNENREEKPNEGLLTTYALLINNLLQNCWAADKKSEKLLAKSKAILKKEIEETKTKYIKTGEEIKYTIPADILEIEKIKIKEQEDPKDHIGNIQFIAPYLDIIIPQPNIR